MSDINGIVAKACKIVSSHDGLRVMHGNNDREHEIVVQGRTINDYLLIGVLAEMLAAGDIEIHEVANKSGRRDYFNKLISSLRV